MLIRSGVGVGGGGAVARTAPEGLSSVSVRVSSEHVEDLYGAFVSLSDITRGALAYKREIETVAEYAVPAPREPKEPKGPKEPPSYPDYAVPEPKEPKEKPCLSCYSTPEPKEPREPKYKRKNL